MGESAEDRCKMFLTLANLYPQPESVPINALVAVAGTPLADQEPVSIFEMVRMIATTRIVLPYTQVRLSAGRHKMSMEGQALCFLAGANSIFSGEKLLTTPNANMDADKILFDVLGLHPMKAFAKKQQPISVPLEEMSPALGENPRWTRI